MLRVQASTFDTRAIICAVAEKSRAGEEVIGFVIQRKE